MSKKSTSSLHAQQNGVFLSETADPASRLLFHASPHATRLDAAVLLAVLPDRSTFMERCSAAVLTTSSGRFRPTISAKEAATRSANACSSAAGACAARLCGWERRWKLASRRQPSLEAVSASRAPGSTSASSFASCEQKGD